MTDPEQEFEAYLQRRPVLPALDDQVEPPAALDRAVLAEAREAIQPHAATNSSRAGGRVSQIDVRGSDPASEAPPRQLASRRPRWAVPVGLAAAILLCLSVVMNISLKSNRPSPNLERMSAARADVKASALDNATSESDASAGVSARAAVRDALTANRGERRESISGDIPSREVVLPRAKVAGAVAPHAPVVAEAPNNEPRDEASDARTDLSAADKAVLMAKDAGVASPQETPAPEAERRAARPPVAAAMVAPHPTDPKVWLQQIDALRAAGKADQADAQMRRFKAAFPNYALPK